MPSASPDSLQVTQASRSNFVSSFWFLSKEKRKALTDIYAFCRITDDIVDAADDDGNIAGARAHIADWKAQTVKAFAGEAQHPVLAALAETARAYRIPHNYFFELIEGVSMDLDRKSYATYLELRSYCYKVASVVGLMCLEVFGYRNLRSRDFAVDLGLAFQLTNILRDLKTDARRGRAYLPEEDLRRFSLTGSDLLALAQADSFGSKDKNFRELIAFEAERAEGLYASAMKHLPREDRRNMAAAEVMSAVYHAILAKVEADPPALLRRKVKLSKPEAFLRILQGVAKNRLGI